MSLDSGPLIDRTLSERTIDLTSTEKSNDSDRTISQTSGSGSTDSEKTLALRVDSQDSQVSDGEPGERSWPRQNSVCLIFIIYFNITMQILNIHLNKSLNIFNSFPIESGTFHLMNSNLVIKSELGILEPYIVETGTVM